jgi:integrase
MRVYDFAQTAELLDAARGERALIPVLLASTCGLRRGEVAALRWRNVCLVAASLSLTHSAEQTKKYGVRYKTPKNGKPRTVALPASVIEELRLHRLAQTQGLLKLRPKYAIGQSPC